ncbi:MAG: DUF4867 family protein [Solobacterium sp.]|nr:DUF4867 family protein [Solobacterium sp.]
MGLLEHLNEVNHVRIFSVHDPEFRTYGRVVTGFDFSGAFSYMEKHTDIPASGNIYVPSVKEMEDLRIRRQIEASFYAGMECQFGYCNGRNTTYNGFEYHKGSEINAAVTDFMLVLGHKWDIRENHYSFDDACVFFVEKGTVIEMYSTTLHLSPCRTSDAGFRCIVILPKGTNSDLTEEELAMKNTGDPETVLLLKRNKWVIAHPDREPLIRQGAWAGITGENRELYY